MLDTFNQVVLLNTDHPQAFLRLLITLPTSFLPSPWMEGLSSSDLLAQLYLESLPNMTVPELFGLSWTYCKRDFLF